MSRKFRALIYSTLLCALLTLPFSVPALSQSKPADPVPAEPKPQVSPAAEPIHPPAVDSKPELPSNATPDEIRMADIEADTKKLYLLSAELRAEVAKTYKESLSITVLKKAQEIEKLARSLKARLNQEATAAKNHD